jgi:hypothetical protein
MSSILNRVLKLPDYVDSAGLKAYFAEVVASQENVLFLIEALDELADRQWHTYTKLDLPTQLLIEDWFKTTWMTDSEKYIGHAISIIACLGLTVSYELLIKSFDSTSSNTVKLMIQEAINELGKTVDQPYFGM